MYDCLTDVFVWQVTLAGPVYSLALGPRTLVALSGWAVHQWTLDCFNPSSVSPTIQASFLDLPSIDGGQSWLEAHSALLSRDFLVTRATQLLGAPATAACYLQVRRVCSVTGVVSPSILRPESSALATDVLEMSDMALSTDGLLATLTMERRDGTPRYVVRIQDCDSGDLLAVLPQTDILASVQVFINDFSIHPICTLIAPRSYVHLRWCSSSTFAQHVIVELRITFFDSGSHLLAQWPVVYEGGSKISGSKH